MNVKRVEKPTLRGEGSPADPGQGLPGEADGFSPAGAATALGSGGSAGKVDIALDTTGMDRVALGRDAGNLNIAGPGGNDPDAINQIPGRPGKGFFPSAGSSPFLFGRRSAELSPPTAAAAPGCVTGSSGTRPSACAGPTRGGRGDRFRGQNRQERLRLRSDQIPGWVGREPLPDHRRDNARLSSAGSLLSVRSPSRPSESWRNSFKPSAPRCSSPRE